MGLYLDDLTLVSLEGRFVKLISDRKGRVQHHQYDRRRMDEQSPDHASYCAPRNRTRSLGGTSEISVDNVFAELNSAPNPFSSIFCSPFLSLHH